MRKQVKLLSTVYTVTYKREESFLVSMRYINQWAVKRDQCTKKISATERKKIISFTIYNLPTKTVIWYL